jgi:hypothetical protein
MFTRERIALDGVWHFWPDAEESLTHELLTEQNSLSIQVPAAWQSQRAELRYYMGVAWYRRQFELPPDWLMPGNLIYIHFGAVDYEAEVWINRHPTGMHAGGYLPFEFDVTQSLTPGLNEVTIRVEDPVSLFPEIPHGKQDWYGPLSGVWQSVWLEQRATCHIRDFIIKPDLSSGRVTAQVFLSDALLPGESVVGKVLAPNGDEIISAQSALVEPSQSPGRLNFNLSEDQVSLDFFVPNPSAWSPDEPYLYRYVVELKQEGNAFDLISKTFGFRTIEARDGQLFLNGKPLYLRGALDQDYYPNTICMPPSQAFLDDQFHKVKALGLNCLRCHIKVADPRYYDTADRLGILIWNDLPNWTTFTEESGQRGQETLSGMFVRDGHHPSIIIWTIINENWGLDLVHEGIHRDWLRETYRWLKALDPSRLVVDNSACDPNFHVQSDLDDYHYYRGLPDHRLEWDEFVKEFAARPAWLYSPDHQDLRTGKEPLIISEFGNWGLPDPGKLVDEQGNEPWWFETGLGWADSVVYPHGIRTRFESLGLSHVFGSWESFIEDTQRYQFAALKYEIEAMRLQQPISGYVITELTDVHWECNGLLDMNRNPKAYFEDFSSINNDTVIIPQWERTAFWSGETVGIHVFLAHAGNTAIVNAAVGWELGSGETRGHIEVPSLPPASGVMNLGTISFTAPAVTAPSLQQVNLYLRTPEGRQLAKNTLKLSIFPRNNEPSKTGIVLFAPDNNLAAKLDALGYPMASSEEKADVVLIDQPGEEELAFARKGGRLVVLSDRLDVSNAPKRDIFPGIQLNRRQDTLWSGDWASSFSWLKRTSPFECRPARPLIDHSFDRVIPTAILTGFREWDFQKLVWAGIFVGWIHKPAVIIGERYFGKGKLVFNTFRLTDELLGSDPVATHIFEGLLELTLI